MPKSAVYPGSFDPITNGHLDIIERACDVFDEIVVAVSNNSQKRHLFSHSDRFELIRKTLKGNRKVKVDRFNGLLVDYLKRTKNKVILRGLRAGSDLEYEFQMAAMNQHQYKDIETVFFMPSQDYTYLSSSMVRELAAHDGNLKGLVPAPVASALKKKFR